MTLVVYNGITFQIYITGDRQNPLEDWRYLTVFIKKNMEAKAVRDIGLLTYYYLVTVLFMTPSPHTNSLCVDTGVKLRL